MSAQEFVARKCVTTPLSSLGEERHDWTVAEVLDLLQQPFSDLMFQAQSVHRRYFDPNEIQVSSLLSIKTGSCS